MRARKLRENIVIFPQSKKLAAIPSGRKISIKFSGWFSMPITPDPSVLGGFSIVVPTINRDVVRLTPVIENDRSVGMADSSRLILVILAILAQPPGISRVSLTLCGQLAEE
mmetsp:Transcript_43285/g.92644  ORF Transcript_43285/g.92644 Transcript_43285/m.92644 type:complete len:111 (+) Transcript_43285:1334-1666(+)